jgi:plasmid maintenance system antidote protein VapI
MPKTGKYANENPLLRLHKGEPYFFIRAQDRLSVQAVRQYAVLLQQLSEWVERDKNLTEEEAINLASSLDEQADEVAHFAAQFSDWQKENPDKVKYPD